MGNVEVVYGLVGVVIGFLASFAVFRARFVAIEKDVETLRGEFRRELEYLRKQATDEWARIRLDIQNACRGDEDYQKRTERREKEMLIILASIARKMNAGNRVTDLGAHIEEANDEP